jgi:hypothetical protein
MHPVGPRFRARQGHEQVRSYGKQLKLAEERTMQDKDINQLIEGSATCY